MQSRSNWGSCPDLIIRMEVYVIKIFEWIKFSNKQLETNDNRDDQMSHSSRHFDELLDPTWKICLVFSVVNGLRKRGCTIKVIRAWIGQSLMFCIPIYVLWVQWLQSYLQHNAMDLHTALGLLVERWCFLYHLLAVHFATITRNTKEWDVAILHIIFNLAVG